MKKRIASLALATAIFMGSLPVYGAVALKDIADSRYKKAIEYTYSKDIVTGYSDGTFRPANTITRAEFAVTVARWRKLKLDKKADFADAKDSWASKEIAAVVKKGWMVGTGDGKFGPDEKISYIEALAAMVRIVGKESEAEEFGGYPLGYSYTADRYGFTKDISGGLESSIYRGAVSQLVYNIEGGENGIGGSGSESIPESPGTGDSLGTVESHSFLESLSIRVEKDVELGAAVEKLPREAAVKLTNGKTILLKINWDYERTNYNQKISGSYHIYGEIELPKGIEDPKKELEDVRATITVDKSREEMAEEKILNRINSLPQQEYSVEYGTTREEALSQLPEKIGITVIGGERMEAQIRWTLDPNYSKDKPGKYTATGTIVLPQNVVDTQGLLKSFEVKVEVREESTDIEIRKVEMIDAYNYRVTLNRRLEILTPSGAGNVEIGGITLAGVSYENGDKRVLLVNTVEALSYERDYTFTVKDLENGAEDSYDYSPSDDKEGSAIARLEIDKHELPAREESLISLKAYNKAGKDITESVRGEIMVRRTDEVTGEDEEFKASASIKLDHNETQFIDIEYINNKGAKIVVEKVRIRGKNRRVVEVVDWTFAGADGPDWDRTEKRLPKGSDRNYLYIMAKDQFGDIGKIKLTDSQELLLTSSNTVIASVGDKNNGLEDEVLSEKHIFRINHVANGTGSFSLVFKEGVKSYTPITLPGEFETVDKSEPKELELEGWISEMSSANGLLDEDRTQTVKVRIKDQHGIYMVPDENVEIEVLSGDGLLESKDLVSGKDDEFEIKLKTGFEGNLECKFSYKGIEKAATMKIVAPSESSVEKMVVEGLLPELIGDESTTIKVYQTDINGIKVKRVIDKVSVEIRNMADAPDKDPKTLRPVEGSNNGEVTISASDLTKNSVNIVTVKVGDVVVETKRLVVR